MPPPEQSDKTEGACEASIDDLECGALAHYEELSKGARSWLSTIPRAIRFYFEAKRKAVAPERGTWNEALDRVANRLQNAADQVGHPDYSLAEFRQHVYHAVIELRALKTMAAPQVNEPNVRESVKSDPAGAAHEADYRGRVTTNTSHDRPTGSASETIMGGIESTPGARSGAYPTFRTSSATPRTDEVMLTNLGDVLYGKQAQWVPAYFARQLEHELVIMTADRDQLPTHTEHQSALVSLADMTAARDRTAALLNEAVEENTRLRGATSGVLSNALLKDLVETRAFDQAIACTQSSYPDTASFIREWLDHYRADAVSASGKLP